jgi:hypothetical protein
MGNVVYQIVSKNSIDMKIWTLKTLVNRLTKQNCKLAGALRKRSIDHIKSYESELLEDIDDIFLGDILEIICTKEEYKIGNEEYIWPYIINKPYKALVIYKHSSYNGYITVLFLDYATYKDYSYRENCYKLSEEFDLCNYDFESGTFKIRKIYTADQDEIELCGER